MTGGLAHYQQAQAELRTPGLVLCACGRAVRADRRAGRCDRCEEFWLTLRSEYTRGDLDEAER